MPINIEYITKQIYGENREYVKNPDTAKIIQQLVRQKTITPVIRELIRDLTQGHIQFTEVLR